MAADRISVGKDPGRGQDEEEVGQVQTAVAIAYPREHRTMIEPDHASIAKRCKERDVACPLCSEPIKQWAGAYSGHSISATSSVIVMESTHVVAECLEPVGLRQPHVRPRRVL